jgi:hypothetical protein
MIRVLILSLVVCFSVNSWAKAKPSPSCFNYIKFSNANKPGASSFAKRLAESLASKDGVVDIDQQYRTDVLTAADSQEKKEFLVAAVMADLRAQSRDIIKGIKAVSSSDTIASNIDSNLQVFDVLVEGAGLQDGILNNGFEQFGKLKTLTVEQTNNIADNFAMSPYFARINSTSRRDETQVEARPGSGNINRLFGGQFQVSDLYNDKYPPFRAFSDATTLNRGTMPDRPILFETKVIDYEELKFSGRPARYKIRLQYGDEQFEVYANHLILTNGVGTETFEFADAATREFIKAERTLLERVSKSESKYPRFMSYNDFRALTEFFDNPFENLVDQKLLFIGDGDSSKTGLEYVFREGPAEGYKQDSTQVGQVGEVVWANVPIEDCKEFAVNTRTRYSKISAAYKNQTLRPKNFDVVRMVKVGDKVMVTFADGSMFRNNDRVIFQRCQTKRPAKSGPLSLFEDV